MSREHVFEHPSQLNMLSLFPLGRTTGLGTLRLGGALANDPEASNWESELNRHYYACGCDMGAKGLIVGLIGGVVLSGLGVNQAGLGGGWAITLAIGVAVAGAVAGKLVGLAHAEARLKNTIRAIQAQWPSSEDKTGMSGWTCG